MILVLLLTSTGQLSCRATCLAYVGESLAMAQGASAEPDISTTRLNRPEDFREE